MSIISVASLQGASTLVSGGREAGDFRHTINVYKDEKLGRTVAGGRIWGDPAVLQGRRVGEAATLRTEGGTRLDVQIQRLSLDGAYAYVGVDGLVPEL